MSSVPKLLWIGVACLASGIAVPAPAGGSDQPAAVKREIIPGSELMTSQERERYRQRVRGAKSPEDDARVRAEHVKQMQERARVRGLRLPETGRWK